MISSRTDYVDRVFERITLDQVHLVGSQLQGCMFVACSFVETVFENCRFASCIFWDCDLSLMQVPSCTFADVRFEKSKVIGVDWTQSEHRQRSQVLVARGYVFIVQSGYRFDRCRRECITKRVFEELKGRCLSSYNSGVGQALFTSE